MPQIGRPSIARIIMTRSILSCLGISSKDIPRTFYLVLQYVLRVVQCLQVFNRWQASRLLHRALAVERLLLRLEMVFCTCNGLSTSKTYLFTPVHFWTGLSPIAFFLWPAILCSWFRGGKRFTTVTTLVPRSCGWVYSAQIWQSGKSKSSFDVSEWTVMMRGTHCCPQRTVLLAVTHDAVGNHNHTLSLWKPDPPDEHFFNNKTGITASFLLRTVRLPLW
jgi:hypothetical protein